MKKILYVSLNIYSQSGIDRKIQMQVDALKSLGNNVDLITVRKENSSLQILLNEKVLVKYEAKIVAINSLQLRINFKWLRDLVARENYDYIYHRYTHTANPLFNKTFRYLKMSVNKIFFEIPTYPYDKEYEESSIRRKVFHYIELMSRTEFVKYVDRIVTYSNCKNIFGVSTINIKNGADMDVTYNEATNCKPPFTLLALSSMENWHGYDRLIEGMRIYVKNGGSDIGMIILAGGKYNKVVSQYLEKIQEYELTRYFKYYEYLDKESLNNIIKEIDLGVGCLAVHRKGVINVRSLKNAEYISRGLRICFSESDDVEREKFSLKVDGSDEPLDIELVTNFLKNNNFNNGYIRRYAESNLNWKSQMKVVSDMLC